MFPMLAHSQSLVGSRMNVLVVSLLERKILYSLRASYQEQVLNIYSNSNMGPTGFLSLSK